MAKNMYFGINAVARKVKQPYFGINAVARKVKNGYVGVNAVARQFFSGGTPLGSLGIETSVYMNVNGVRKEFIVVNQGLPSTSYDSSCNGTWLLMKDIFTKRTFDSTNHDYANSDVHSYLNNTFLNLLDADIRSIIKQVRIPYRKGTGESTTVSSGANGLSTKVFLLSYTEVGCSGDSYAPIEGSRLSKFNSGSNTRYAYYNGSATQWWLRTPSTTNNKFVNVVNTNGVPFNSGMVTNSFGVRPALIFPSETLIDESFNIIAS